MFGDIFGGAPKQIDPREAIGLQQRANIWNQTTPFGSVDYRVDQGGAKNDNRVTVRLSPEQQRILEQQQLGALLSGQIGAEQLAAFGAGGAGANRQRVEQASFDRMLSLLNPQFDRQESRMTQRLANQGLSQASGAYGREFGRFEDSRNRALESAALQSVLAGGGEETRQLNQILGILSGAQVQQPQFVNPPTVTVPMQQPQQGGDIMSLLLGLGGAGLGGAFGGALGSAAGYQVGVGSGQTLRGY